MPVHEQALLFSKKLEELTEVVKVALPKYESYLKLFSKIKFMRLLDSLAISHPATRYFTCSQEIKEDIPYPCYIKTEYGTASSGVWKIESPEELEELLKLLAAQGIMDGATNFILQELAEGYLEIAYACFDQGELIALHCCQRKMEGARGSSSSKCGVDRPAVKRHFEAIGRQTSWHGPLAIDYIYNPETEHPLYIDASPRMVEPMNAFLNGVNFPEMQIILSTGKGRYARSYSTRARTSHMIMMAILGLAERGATRREICREIIKCFGRKGVYANSVEELNSLKIDCLSIIPLFVVAVQVLVNPVKAKFLSESTVASYALSLNSIMAIDRL